MKHRRWLLWVGLMIGCTSPPEAWSPRRRSVATPFRHVVLIVVDTLRADVTVAADTPTIDGLARSGAAVPRAWSSGTWTVPSIISLFTGAPVRTHGWDLPAARLGQYPPVPPRPTLAEHLQQAGFQTTGIYANPYLSEALGFDRGFDRWMRSSDARMPQRLERTLKSMTDPDGRHFIYIHLLGPHSPLLPSESSRQRAGVDASWFKPARGLGIGAAKRNRPDGVRDAYRRAYTAVVEDTDRRVAEVLQALGDRRADALVILTSDHGELLGEHNIVGHGRHLYEPLTHVPIVVSDVVDLPATMTIDAIPDLVSRLVGVPGEWPTRVAMNAPLVSQREGSIAMSVDGQVKGIWTDKEPQAFDLHADPFEHAALPIPAALAQAHTNWIRVHPPGESLSLQVQLSPEIQEELRALGYAE